MKKEILEKELKTQNSILDNSIEELASNCNEAIEDYISETIDSNDVYMTASFEDIYIAMGKLEDSINSIIQSYEEGDYSINIKELRDNLEATNEEIGKLDDSFFEYKDYIKDSVSINKKIVKELFDRDADGVIDPIVEIHETYQVIDDLEIALKHCIFNE